MNLSGNNITKVDGCARFGPSLETLLMSANPINDLDDVKDISNLPMIRSLAFCEPDYAACEICDIQGYHEYILTQVTSPYLEKLDGFPVSQETRGTA